MSIEIEVLDDKEVVVIVVSGDVDSQQVTRMREESVSLHEQTGHKNFIVDLRKLDSLESGKTPTIMGLGYTFSEVGFSVWTNTAVLLPVNENAREQVSLLHTVEVNRGRGVLKNVESFEEAFDWFQEMIERENSG